MRDLPIKSRDTGEDQVIRILECISDGLVILDRDWRYTYLNTHAERMLGRPRSRLLGKCIWEEFPAVVGTEVERQVRRAASEQVICEFDSSNATRNDRYENRVFPTLDGGVAIYFRDVTERKQTEEKLRLSEVLLAEAQQLAHIGSWNSDLHSNEILWSDEHYRMAGLAPQEITMTRDPSVSYIHPDDRAEAEETVAKALRERTAYEWWLRWVREDGTVRFAQSRGRAAYDEQGKPVRMFGTIQDVAERKQAEDALRKSEERFRVALSASPAITVFNHDKDLRYTWVFNPVIHSSEEIIGKTDADLHNKEDASRLMAIKRGVLESGVRRREEVWLTQGERRFFDLTVEPLHDVSGQISGLTCVVVEITDRKRAEEALQRAHAEMETHVRNRTAELAQANEALRAEVRERRQGEEARTELLRRLATAQEAERRRISRELHDQVGQQLTFLSLGLKALRDSANGAPPDGEFLARLQNTVEELGRQIHDVALWLRPTALDDLGLHAALLGRVEDWSRSAGVQVKFHSHGLDGPRLPDEAETTLYRVVLEALRNILKHARAQNVSVILERRQDHAQAIVEDDGVGFDAESILIRPPPGRLGLLGMRERVALVGGSLEVESSSGAGTTVFARIPLRPDGERKQA